MYFVSKQINLFRLSTRRIRLFAASRGIASVARNTKPGICTIPPFSPPAGVLPASRPPNTPGGPAVAPCPQRVVAETAFQIRPQSGKKRKFPVRFFPPLPENAHPS